MTVQSVLGVAAGLIELLSLPLYVRSILHGRTRPDRVTWWILALVSAMLAASYYGAGARETIWLALAFTLCTLAVAVLSLKYGEGPPTLGLIDRVSLAGALASALLWSLLNSSVVALFLSIATEFVGLVPTIDKSHRRPWTESKAPWVIGTVAALLNVLAINEWTPTIALYPVYIFVTNLLITYFLVRNNKS
jgi:hypothetical protein